MQKDPSNDQKSDDSRAVSIAVPDDVSEDGHEVWTQRANAVSSVRHSEPPMALEGFARRMVSNFQSELPTLHSECESESEPGIDEQKGETHAVMESDQRHTRGQARQAAVAAILSTSSEAGDLTIGSHPQRHNLNLNTWQQGSYSRTSYDPGSLTPSFLRPHVQNDPFLGTSAPKIPVDSIAAAMSRTGGKPSCMGRSSQNCARLAAARIQAALQSGFLEAEISAPDHMDSGTHAASAISIPFDVPIRNAESMLPSDGNSGLPHSGNNTAFLDAAQVNNSCLKSRNSYDNTMASNHSTPILSRLSQALQHALHINSQVMPEEMAAAVTPTSGRQGTVNSTSSRSASTPWAPCAAHDINSPFASAPRYIPSVSVLARNSEYPGAHSRTVSPHQPGDARWTLQQRNTAVKSTPNLSQYFTTVPDSSNGPYSVEFQGLPLQHRTVVSKSVGGQVISSKAGAGVSLRFTPKARQIAIEAAENMQLMDACDHGGTLDKDEYAYMKKLRGSVSFQDSLPQGYSFGVFPPDWPPRRVVFTIVEHRYFDNAMSFCVALSCALMVYEHPALQPGALDTTIVHYGDISLTLIFGLEIVLKMFALGAVPYLKVHTNKVRHKLTVHARNCMHCMICEISFTDCSWMYS